MKWISFITQGVPRPSSPSAPSDLARPYLEPSPLGRLLNLRLPHSFSLITQGFLHQRTPPSSPPSSSAPFRELVVMVPPKCEERGSFIMKKVCLCKLLSKTCKLYTTRKLSIMLTLRQILLLFLFYLLLRSLCTSGAPSLSWLDVVYFLWKVRLAN